MIGIGELDWGLGLEFDMKKLGWDIRIGEWGLGNGQWKLGIGACGLGIEITRGLS